MNIVTMFYLFQGAHEESEYHEYDECRRECSGRSHHRLEYQGADQRLLPAVTIGQEAEQNGAKHDTKVEYHQRCFG